MIKRALLGALAPIVLPFALHGQTASSSLLIASGDAVLSVTNAATPGTSSVSLTLAGVTAVPRCFAIDHDKMGVLQVTTPVLSGTTASFMIYGTSGDHVSWFCLQQ